MRSRVQIPSATPTFDESSGPAIERARRNPPDPVRQLRAVVRLAALARTAGPALRGLPRPAAARGAGAPPPHRADRGPARLAARPVRLLAGPAVRQLPLRDSR